MASGILALLCFQLAGAIAAPEAEEEDELTPLVPISRTTPAPVAAPQPAPATPTVTRSAPPEKSGLGLELGLKLAVVFPVGKAGATQATVDGAVSTSRSVAPAAALTLRYRLPFARSLLIAAEGGYSRLAGSGSRELTNDPDFGAALAWTWKMDLVPILLGLAWELPLGLPIKFAPVAGGAAIFVSSQSTYGELAGAPQPAWAFGWYAGLEASLPLGPGAIALEARYLGARTDLGFPRLYGKTVNGSPGDVQGTQVLAGYRFSF